MEFDFIARHFQAPFAALWQQHGLRWPEGLNNDCAALQPQPGERLWTSTDTLVEGVHWFAGHTPQDIGWKALASNVSDLMACGAQPVGFVLAMTLPTRISASAQHEFLAAFSAGLLACAQHYQCPLVGGDTTSASAHAPGLVLTLTVFGVAPQGHNGFARHAAAVGEGIWVSGLPGLARLGLLCASMQHATLQDTPLPQAMAQHTAFLQGLPAAVRAGALLALHRPEPPVALSLALRGVAHAALDLSDGLGGDLAHIAQASQCQLVLEAQALLGLWRQAYPNWVDGLSASDQERLLECSLIGGDDYQLCWTQADDVPIQGLAADAHVPVSRIGRVQAGQGLALHRPQGLVPMPYASYQHFCGQRVSG